MEKQANFKPTVTFSSPVSRDREELHRSINTKDGVQNHSVKNHGPQGLLLHRGVNRLTSMLAQVHELPIGLRR